MKLFPAFALSILFFSCKHAVKPETKELGFYFWKSKVSLSDFETSYLENVHAKKIYVKLFDVDTIQNEHGIIKVIPVAKFHVSKAFPSQIQIIPVVYITRQALLQHQNLDTLSYLISKLTEQICTKNNWTSNEIQWDMDWTPSTKLIYFDLLKKLKKQPYLSSKIFSATIRLHQIKHQRITGIPPVDKGLLMCYNMGNLKQYGANNSILDIEIVKDYLKNMRSYPIPLDIGLPLFRWSLQFRNKNFVGILNDISDEDLSKNKDFTLEKNSIFLANKNTILHTYSILKNDEIRIETSSFTALKKLAQITSARNNNSHLSILFYHLDSNLLQNFKPYELQNLMDTY